MVIWRPGPDAIDSGGAPGGFVFHLYRDTELLAVDAVSPPGRGPSDEMIAQALNGRVPCCLVVYDGDTGRRLGPDQLGEVGLRSGQPL